VVEHVERGDMYRRLPDSEGNTLGFTVEGEVTQEDVRRMQDDIEELIAAHGEVSVLMRLDRMDEIALGAVWQDLKMLGGYLRSLERVAVVGDPDEHRWVSQVSNLLADAKLFHPHELPEAWQWVRGRTGSYASMN
jgi:hypothetical protein